MEPQTGHTRAMLVVGNWKMNGDQASNDELLQAIKQYWPHDNRAQAAICPAFVHLEQVARTLKDTPVGWGAQTLNPNDNGAYTGEVSAAMLTDMGCRYVIVGHNERRRLQSESDAQVAQQFAAAQQAGLIPILCVGESTAEREADQTLMVIRRQLTAVTAVVGSEAFASAVVAYEPIWAVGTGKTATPEEVEVVHKYIRQEFGALGNRLPILYGGSVKPDNAANLFAKADIDGALLGGASLKANDFLAICRRAHEAR